MRYSWLIVQNNGNGVKIFCDRPAALQRENNLKLKEACTISEIAEIMAIRLCLNNSISITQFYNIQSIKYHAKNQKAGPNQPGGPLRSQI